VTPPEHWSGPPLELVDGEAWIFHLVANRAQGKRAVAGGLHLTTQRLLFTPSVVEARLGGKPWSCASSEIASVGVQPGRRSLLEMFSGGREDRLRIDLTGGTQQLFVVRDPARVAEDLRKVLGVPEPAGELPAARVVKT
jgi:hypothetical protein